MALSLELSYGMVAEWHNLFVQVNADCHITGDPVMSFEDTEYYAHQIHNLMDEIDWAGAELMAYAIRDHHRRLIS